MNLDLCKINYKNNEIYSLITKYKVIIEEMLNKKYIEIKINNRIKKIYLNKKIWVNKVLDYICIEISKDDDIEILEIDSNENPFSKEEKLRNLINEKDDFLALLNKPIKEDNQAIIIISINKNKEI